jgi:hypothetical protein
MLQEAREFPFETLTGCPVEILVCEDLYASSEEWHARWPGVRRRTDFGVFLDHLGGWVARGTWVEVNHLLADGKPVFWFRDGEPTDRFGFGPGMRGDWAGRYRRVGLRYGRPVRNSLSRPLPRRRAV